MKSELVTKPKYKGIVEKILSVQALNTVTLLNCFIDTQDSIILYSDDDDDRILDACLRRDAAVELLQLYTIRKN